jgi:hypothetical protein
MEPAKIYHPKDCETCSFFRRDKNKGRTAIQCMHYPGRLFSFDYKPKPDFCIVERIEVYEKGR